MGKWTRCDAACKANAIGCLGGCPYVPPVISFRHVRKKVANRHITDPFNSISPELHPHLANSLIRGVVLYLGQLNLSDGCMFI